MKRLLITIIICAVLAMPTIGSAAPVHQDAPRLANIFLHWVLPDVKARDLAKWDVVILDMDIQTSNPNAINLMRSLNPDIRILAYVPLVEVRQSAQGLAHDSLRYRMAQELQDQWYLTDPNGRRLQFWDGTWTMNITNECPRVNGQRWNDFISNFVKSNIIASGLWDGVFYDNGWDNVTHFVGSSIDFNRDGRAAGYADADRLWKEGIAQTLDRTANMIGGNYLVVLNDGPYYAEHTRGVAIENFSGRDWSDAMEKYRSSIDKSRDPDINTINSNTRNSGNMDDYRMMRFGYGSSLLYDGYYSFDFGDRDHGQTWWYDEYNAYLGVPKSGPENVTQGGSEIRPGLWKREFANGLVLVNSTYEEKSMDLLGEYEKLHGTQDPRHNDGAIVSDVIVQARDSVILIRPIEKIIDATYTNGSFVRIFNEYGEVYRTGFFAYDGRFRGGTQVVEADINADGAKELVVADINRVYIYDAAGNLYKSFYPYTENYRGGVNITVGDLDQDADMEIVTGTENGGGPHIRIFNHDGVLINPGFFAYGKEFRGGVHVTIGDLNGDGWKEIIAGAGYGGGPHVRVFGLDGRLINPGFFAYNPAFRGGVYVAAGDVNGDGRDEIITGAGPGGGPHVRIFNERGETLDNGGFFAYDVNDNEGVSVTSADIDSDGRDEIIAETTSVFTLSLIN